MHITKKGKKIGEMNQKPVNEIKEEVL